ncbi:ribbon-helix-helix domain-containing protein [Kitasatospora sp. NPDC004531]
MPVGTTTAGRARPGETHRSGGNPSRVRISYPSSFPGKPSHPKKKVTVTLPEELLDEIRADSADRGLSAYVADALRAKRDRDRLQELVVWLEDEHGPVSGDERAAAYAELDDVDAEHDRCRAARDEDSGAAA